jgi:hypothetical protein
MAKWPPSWWPAGASLEANPWYSAWRTIMGEYSKHQQKVIRNYYDNKEAISLQRLGELVTELYLAEGKKRDQYWTQIVQALTNLKVPASRIQQLQKTDNPALVAKLLEELLAKE